MTVTCCLWYVTHNDVLLVVYVTVNDVLLVVCVTVNDVLLVVYVTVNDVLIVADDTEDKDESLSLSSNDEATLEQLLEGEGRKRVRKREEKKRGIKERGGKGENETGGAER